jgi:hypothetical protein
MQRGAIDDVQLCDGTTQAGNEGVLHLWSSEHMRRGVTLCGALHWAVKTYTGIMLALGRLTTHGCEEHFGNIRELVPGDDSWLKWMRAEVCAAIDVETRAKLAIPGRVRPKRLPVGGVIIRKEGFEGSEDGSPEGSLDLRDVTPGPRGRSGSA